VLDRLRLPALARLLPATYGRSRYIYRISDAGRERGEPTGGAPTQPRTDSYHDTWHIRSDSAILDAIHRIRGKHYINQATAFRRAKLDRRTAQTVHPGQTLTLVHAND
jgi:hypothetical protein